MQEHQARILSRIVDEIDRHRGGETTAPQLFNNLWGLITAAEVQGKPEGAEVEDLYLAASGADDLRQPSMPPDVRASDSDVDARWIVSASGHHGSTRALIGRQGETAS